MVGTDSVAHTGPVFAAAEGLAGVWIAGDVPWLDCTVIVVASRAGEVAACGGEEEKNGIELKKASRAVTL